MGMRVRGVCALVLLRAFPWVWELVAAGFAVVGVVAAVLAGSPWPAVISGLGIYLGYVVARASVAAGRSAREPAAGPSAGLPREAHPVLWAELDDVAAALRRPAVEYVLADASPGVRVTGGAGLTVGLPLLAALDRPALRTVIAQTLAEGGDRSVPARTARADAWLGAVRQHTGTSPFAGLFAAYHRAARAAAGPPLRGRGQGGADLRRIAAAWALLHERYLPLADPADPARAASALEGLLGVLEADGWTVRGAPAAELLGRGGSSLDELELALGLRGAEPVGWDDVVAPVAAGRARERTAVLLGALGRLEPGAEPSVAALLRALAAGSGPLLARGLLPADLSPAEVETAWRDALVQHLDSAVFTLLAAGGRARVRVDWSRRWRVEVPGTGRRAVPWPFEGPLRAAADGDPRAVPWLAEAIRSLGGDAERRLPAGPAAAGSTLRGAAGPVLERPGPDGRRRRRSDLLVYDDGLLIGPSPRRPRGFSAAATAGFRQLTRLAAEAGRDPAGWARRRGRQARWIPMGEVVSSSGWRPWLGERRWTLRLADGSSFSVTTTGETGWIGMPDGLTGPVARSAPPAAGRVTSRATSGRAAAGAGRRGS